MGVELAKGWKINKNNKVPLPCPFPNFERMQVSLFLAALEMMELPFHIKFQNTNNGNRICHCSLLIKAF